MLPTRSVSTASTHTAGRHSVAVGGNATVEDAQQRGERGDLRRRGHERGDRRGRALVHVGRPHVERHRGDLEPEADQQQHEPGQQRARFEQGVGAEERVDAGERRGAGARRTPSAMPYRKIADENAPSTKYLMPASCDVSRRRSIRGEHVERDRQDLQRQEHDDEVVGGGHHHHAHRREEHERHVLGASSCSRRR